MSSLVNHGYSHTSIFLIIGWYTNFDLDGIWGIGETICIFYIFVKNLHSFLTVTVFLSHETPDVALCSATPTCHLKSAANSSVVAGFLTA